MKWPWQWRKVKKEWMPDEERKLFDLYGEDLVRNLIAGQVGAGTPPELAAVYNNSTRMAYATNWLIEYVASNERREDRLEFIECLILFLVFAGVILDVFLLYCSR